MPVGRGPASRYNRRVRIERPLTAEGIDAAGSGQWQMVWEGAAGVQDALPSRGERLADGINVAARPAKVRIRYRGGITAAMRIVLLRWDAGTWVADRLMEIVAGPAEIGFRQELEFMVEDYTSAGNAA